MDGSALREAARAAIAAGRTSKRPLPAAARVRRTTKTKAKVTPTRFEPEVRTLDDGRPTSFVSAVPTASNTWA